MRFPERVAGEEQQMRIEWRKNNRLGAQHPEIVRLHWHRQNRLRLTGAPIESRQFATVNCVRIERIGHHVAVFLGRDRSPVAKRDLAFVATAADSNRAAFLLPAVKTIRKCIVRADVIQLGSRLIIPRAPRCSAVDRDNRALVRAEEDDVRIIWVDPDVLIIVAARRTAPAIPRLATVCRFPTDDAGRVNDLRIFWIKAHDRQIAAADAEARARIVGCSTPGFAAIFGTIKFRDGFRPDDVRLHDIARQSVN